MAWDLLFRNASLATMDDPRELEQIHNGAVAVKDGVIVWLGPEAALPAGSAAKEIDLAGRVLTPGLVDPHTHVAYGDEGLEDFEVLSQGGGRPELIERGIGVFGVARRTREMTEDSLYAASRVRVARLIANGVTTVESKSGAGLDLETELMSMRVSRSLDLELPVSVISTFLGAHGLPPEFADRRDDYIDFLCETVLPAAVQQGIVDQVDGFCDDVGFTHAQIGRLFARAASFGLPVKLHADQYSDFGAGAVVARHGGLSADHLEYASEETVMAMAEAGTVATLLPGANWTLHETQKPPVEWFRKHGVPMALATNCNPVSSPSTAPALIMHMACYMFGLSPVEALRGFTVNSARALGIENVAGRIARNRPADLVAWETDDARGIPYPIGGAPCHMVVKGGVIVHVGTPSLWEDF